MTIRLPYYAFRPGTAPSVTDLVELRHGPRFPPKGDVLLTSVAVRTTTAFDAVRGWLDPDTDVISVPRVLGTDPTPAVRREFERQNDETTLARSRDDAVLAAVRYLGLPYTERGAGAVVAAVVPGSAAEGRLSEGEVITAVDGRPTPLASDVSSAVKAHQPGQRLTMEVVRADGTKRQVEVVLGSRQGDESGFLGVSMQTKDHHVAYPFEVSFRGLDVGGSSGGLAFTLALVDWLTPGELTGGRRVATAGTITTDGRVGPVDGIPQKVVAAERAGAAYVLVPPANSKLALEHAEGRMKVLTAATLDEGIAALGHVGGDPSGLPARRPASPYAGCPTTRRSGVFRHLVDLVSHQPVRLSVDGIRGFGIGRVDKAEDLPCLLVHPVLTVRNAILVLGGQVGLMRLGHVGR